MKLPVMVICTLVFGFQADAEGILVHEGGYACCVLQCGTFLMPINPLCVPRDLVTGVPHPAPVIRKTSVKRKRRCFKCNPLLKKPKVSSPARKEFLTESSKIRKDKRPSGNSKPSTSHDSNIRGNSFRGCFLSRKPIKSGNNGNGLGFGNMPPERTNDLPLLGEEPGNTELEMPKIAGIISHISKGYLTEDGEPWRTCQNNNKKLTKIPGERDKKNRNKQETPKKSAMDSEEQGRQQFQSNELNNVKKPACKKLSKQKKIATRNSKERTSKRSDQPKETKGKAVSTERNKKLNDKITQAKEQLSNDDKKSVPKKSRKQNATGQDNASAEENHLGKKNGERSPSTSDSKPKKQRQLNTLGNTAKENQAIEEQLIPSSMEKLLEENMECQPMVEQNEEINPVFEIEANQQPNHENGAATDYQQIQPFSKQQFLLEEKEKLANSRKKLSKEKKQRQNKVKQKNGVKETPENEGTEKPKRKKKIARGEKERLPDTKGQVAKEGDQRVANSKEKDAKEKKERPSKIQTSTVIDHNSKTDAFGQPNRKKKVAKAKRPVPKSKEQVGEEQFIVTNIEKLMEEMTERQPLVEQSEAINPLFEIDAGEQLNLENQAATEDQQTIPFNKDQAEEKKQPPANSEVKLTKQMKEHEPAMKQKGPQSGVTEKPKRKKKVGTSRNEPLANNKGQGDKIEKLGVTNNKKLEPVVEEINPDNLTPEKKASKPLKKAKAMRKDLLRSKTTNAFGSNKDVILPSQIVLQDSSHKKGDTKKQIKPDKSSSEQGLPKTTESELPEKKYLTPDSTTVSNVEEQSKIASDLDETLDHARSKVLDANDIRKVLLEKLTRTPFKERIIVSSSEIPSTAQDPVPRSSVPLPNIQRPDSSSSTMSPNLEKVFEELARLIDTILKTSEDSPDHNKLLKSSTYRPPTEDEKKEMRSTAYTKPEEPNNVEQVIAKNHNKRALNAEAIEISRQYKLAKELPTLKMKNVAAKVFAKESSKDLDTQGQTAPQNMKETPHKTSDAFKDVHLRKATHQRQRKIEKVYNEKKDN